MDGRFNICMKTRNTKIQVTENKVVKVSVESQNVYVIGYNKLKQFMKDQLDKSDALTDEQIEEIYQKLLPGTQLSDAEKQEHIERIRKTYKK